MSRWPRPFRALFNGQPGEVGIEPEAAPIREDPWQPGYWRHTQPWGLSERPEIVTLCGSTRFAQEFFEVGKVLTLKGQIVLSVEVTTTQSERDDPQFADPHTKTMLDALHFEKIRMSDYVFVINKGGYIGWSTTNEIDYAKSLGKPVVYMDNISPRVGPPKESAIDKAWREGTGGPLGID